MTLFTFWWNLKFCCPNGFEVAARPCSLSLALAVLEKLKGFSIARSLAAAFVRLYADLHDLIQKERSQYAGGGGRKKQADIKA